MALSRRPSRCIASSALFACFIMACSAGDDSANADDDIADDDTGEPEPEPGTFNGSKCNTVSRDEVAATLGHPDLSEPDVDEFGSGAQCTYATTENPAAVMILYYEDMTSEEFAQQRQDFDESGQPTSNITGLGDAAYLAETAPGVGAVGALQGTDSILVSGLGEYSAMQTLAAEILTRL